MTPELFWIPGLRRGRLAITPRPRGGDWLRDEARTLKGAGVDIVVSLLERDEAEQLGLADEAKIMEANDLRFVSFPVPDRGVPASLPDATALAAGLGSELEAGSTVAIHCRQSVGRSGLIAASVLTILGLDAEQAIKIVSAARGQTVPETAEQRSWVLEFAAKRVVLTR